MNKREMILSLAQGGQALPYVPAAFFLHFPPAFHAGQASVEKHLEYFRYTGMDFIKIQYEATFPHRPEIQRPDDWARLPRLGREFFAGQLEAVEGLVRAARREAVIVLTLYSPFMCAGQSASTETVEAHLRREPEKVRRGLEIITDSLLGFVRDCIRVGVDGFYMSTQGGEAGRFADPRIFEEFIRPYDLVLMEAAHRACAFNILHVCDYVRDYDDFTPFVAYPGTVVSSPLKVGGRRLAPRQAAELFKRPYMGGLERLGVIARGTPDQIRQAAEAVLAEAPSRFILAADCTVPGDTPWDNLKVAIDAAHAHHPAEA